MTSQSNAENPQRTAPKRRRGRSLRPEVLDEIGLLSAKLPALSAASIHQAVVEKFGDGLAPSQRTVWSIVGELRGAAGRESWMLEPANAVEAAVTLPVLAALAATGHPQPISRLEVEWLVLLHAIAPVLPPWSPPRSDGSDHMLAALRLAQLYISRRALGLPTDDLDHFLGSAPWRSKAAAARYLSALLTRHFYPVPQWLAKAVPTGEWFGIEVVAAFSPGQEVQGMAVLYNGATPFSLTDKLLELDAFKEVIGDAG